VKTKKGFTLIELLVVIAIIAILAAILFPVFARARDKARQTTCLSNSKQIALGVLMYCDDYDEILPAAGCAMDLDLGVAAADVDWTDYGTGYDGNWGWAHNVAVGNLCQKVNYQLLILPYIKTSKIFHCPNDPNGKDSSSYYAAAESGWYSGAVTAVGGVNEWPWQPLGAVKDPGNTILTVCSPLDHSWVPDIVTGIAEYTPYAGINDELPYWAYPPVVPGNRLDITNPVNMCVPWMEGPCSGAMLCTVWPAAGYMSPWTQNHNGGTNYSFVDGHAKWLRVEDTVTPHDLWSRADND